EVERYFDKGLNMITNLRNFICGGHPRRTKTKRRRRRSAATMNWQTVLAFGGCGARALGCAQAGEQAGDFWGICPDRSGNADAPGMGTAFGGSLSAGRWAIGQRAASVPRRYARRDS